MKDEKGAGVVEEPLFYTETMARLLVRQGKLREAAEVYRYLLTKDSGRPRIRDALAQLEKMIGGGRTPRQQETADLFARWIELRLRLHNVNKLGACLKRARKGRSEKPE